MASFVRILMLVAMILTLSEISGAATRKKNRMKISFTPAQASAPSNSQKRIRLGSQHDGMISVRAAKRKSTADARRDFIANSTTEDEIIAPTEDDFVEPVAPREPVAKPVAQSMYYGPSSTMGSRTRFSRRSSGRSGLTLVPTLGMSSSGVTYDGMNGDMEMTSSTRGYGFTAGALMEFGRGFASFELGGLYFQENYSAKGRIDDDGYLSETTFKNGSLSFIGAPVAARLNLVRSHDFRFHVKGGVIPAYMVESYFEYETENSDEYGSWNNSGSYSASDEMNSFNIFMLVGGGIEFGIGNGKDLRLEGVYRRSMLPMSTEGNATIDSILMSAGLGFDL